MSGLFNQASGFNADLSKWNTDLVEDMKESKQTETNNLELFQI